MKVELTTSPIIVGLRLEADGVFISFRCESCSVVCEAYLTTIGSLAIGHYHCGSCGFTMKLRPNDFEKYLSTMFPELTTKEQIQLTEEATRITESWYHTSTMAELFSYKGINLGEGLERELMPIVLQGLYQAKNCEDCDL